MSFDLTRFMIVLVVVLAISVLLLWSIRKTLLPRSTVVAGAAAVTVTILMGQVAAWFMAALPIPNITILLVSGFVGLFVSQPNIWRVSSMCRALALVSLIVSVWAMATQQLVELSVSLLATGGLLYVSLLASKSEAHG